MVDLEDLGTVMKKAKVCLKGKGFLELLFVYNHLSTHGQAFGYTFCHFIYLLHFW